MSPKLKLLHLDVSEGCSGELIIAALAALGVAPRENAAASPLEQAMSARIFSLLPAAAIDDEMIGQINTFCSMISQLDPAAITATKVAISWPSGAAKTQILKLAEGIPTFDSETPCDVLGLALLKTFAHSFGVRPESTLLKIGTSNSKNGCVRALLCEPRAIATHEHDSANAQILSQPAIKVDAVLGLHADKEYLLQQLNYLGAESLHLFHAVNDRNFLGSNIQVSCVAPFAKAPNIIEALLVLGHAQEVMSAPVERHYLTKKTVTVPLGRQQNMRSCQVVEWKLGDKTVRAEPDHIDLLALSKKSGFSLESTRDEVLSTWRRWCRSE